jgi:cytochrome c
MTAYRQRLITLALAAWLAGCGGGESLFDHNPSARTGPHDNLNSSAASIPEPSVAGGDDALPGTTRPSPAQALGIQRPPRPEHVGASSPNLPARTPHHNAISIDTLRQYCPVQPVQWTSADGELVCAGTTPIGVRPEWSSNTSVANQLLQSMGSITLQCQRDETGQPHWVVVTPALLFPGNPNTTPFSSCDLRPPPPPPITDPQQLAQARNCFACHRESGGALIGPSFEQVADRYRDAPLPPGELESRIRNGSVGNWNNFPMPSNPQVSDTDLGILVPWILSR